MTPRVPEYFVWFDGTEWYVGFGTKSKNQRASTLRAGLSHAWYKIEKTGGSGNIHVYNHEGMKVQIIDVNHLDASGQICTHPDDRQFIGDKEDIICLECGWCRDAPSQGVTFYA